MNKKVLVGILSFLAFSTHVNAENIEQAYVYNEQSCVTGEEATCQKTTCYGNNSKGSCASGTIIKYKVNTTESKYFYVLHDDGTTMTLQARENIASNIGWYQDSSAIVVTNTKGPLNALVALEEATKNWVNVNNQTYTLGTTAFPTSSFTGCHLDGTKIICDKNQYTLPQRTAKARLISVEEAVQVGCKPSTIECPKYMYNYLKEATLIGGTNDGTDYRYWTMNARTEDIYNTYAYSIEMGEIGASAVETSSGDYPSGVRPVIVINKEKINSSDNDNNNNNGNNNDNSGYGNNDNNSNNGNNSATNTDNKDNNNPNSGTQTVKVGNTAATIYTIGYIVGFAILITGVYVVYKSIYKQNDKI